MYYDNNYYSQFVCGDSPVTNKPFFYEQWRYITQDVVPFVLPNRYLVSNYGEVKSAKTGKLMSIYTKYGYRQVMLYGVHNKSICARIDRLVLMTFYPVPNMHSLQVNHRDTNTERDSIDNLEWCTPKMNTVYAELNGSRSKQKTIFSKREKMMLDDTTLNNIAIDISERKLSQREISEKYNVCRTVIEDISRGKLHKDLYIKYNLGELKGSRPHVSEASVDQIHQMCIWMMNNMYDKNIYQSKINYVLAVYNAVGINKTKETITDSNRNFVINLLKRKIYRDITQQYDLSKAYEALCL